MVEKVVSTFAVFAVKRISFLNFRESVMPLPLKTRPDFACCSLQHRASFQI